MDEWTDKWINEEILGTMEFLGFISLQIWIISCCFSVDKPCPTLCDPMDFRTSWSTWPHEGHGPMSFSASQASLSFTIPRSLFKLMSIESVMPSNRLIPCHLLLLLPSIFPSIRGFSNELALHIIDSELLPRLTFQVREPWEAQTPWTLHLSLGGMETSHAVPIFEARKF